MPDIFGYFGSTVTEHLHQFLNVKKVAANICCCKAHPEYTKEMFLADFPQFAKTTTSYAASTFERDPSMVGGPLAIVEFDGFTATVSGTIAYYPEDMELGRPAGHRVGFQVVAPSDLEDVSNCLFSIDDGPPELLANDPNVSGNPRVFWWYPLVTADTTQHILALDWDGFGERGIETFTINYVDFMLAPELDDNEAMPIVRQMYDFSIRAAEAIESVIPDAMLEMFIYMALDAIQLCRWGIKWRIAVGWYIAHYATLYLEAYKPASPDNDASSGANSGQVLGLLKAAQLGDASLQYDVSAAISATQDWGAFNLTTYGQLLASEARFAGLGGAFII